MSAPEPPKTDLIESSNVPDLERVVMQEMLNVMTRRGELSGPTINEDGKDSAMFQQRLREREARMNILDTVIEMARPSRAEFRDARDADERALDFAQSELEFIPDGAFGEFTPKDACAKKVRLLEDFFYQKWDVGGNAVETIDRLLADPPAPGGLLRPDGRFIYPDLDRHLSSLRDSEEALAQVERADPDFFGLDERVNAYREAIMAGLGGRKGGAAQTSAPNKPPAAAEPARPEPARRPQPQEVVIPPDPVEMAFRAWCLDVELKSYDDRVLLLAELEADGVDLDDRKVGFVATSIVLERPAELTPALADRLDERGLRGLASQVADPELAGLPGRARMAIIKQLASRTGPRAELRGNLAGTFAANLVRQHPKALAELLEHTDGPNKGTVIQCMSKHLSDDEITGFGRETLHAIYKACGTATTDDARRQAARLVRLANKK